MAVIKEDKLNQDVLLKVFQESAHEAAADDDGDVYITDGLEGIKGNTHRQYNFLKGKMGSRYRVIRIDYKIGIFKIP